MNLKRILLLVVFFSTAVGWAQSQRGDPILVDNVSFRNLNRSDISGVGGQVVRCEVVILPKFNPDGTKSKWLRNVEVEVLCAYPDQKNKNGYVMLSSRAKIFAAQINKKTPVVFYVPWEAYDVYGLKGDPYMYKVSLFYNGQEIPLTAANLSSRLSKNINSQQMLESFENAVGKGSSVNAGVLKPLNECGTNFQMYEYNKAGPNNPVPTYLDVR